MIISLLFFRNQLIKFFSQVVQQLTELLVGIVGLLELLPQCCSNRGQALGFGL